MGRNASPDLQSRIVNCLQTILEMETDLRRLELGHMLLKEFNVLRSFLSKIDAVRIEEEDVVRIERATENFLEELRAPLARIHQSREANSLSEAVEQLGEALSSGGETTDADPSDSVNSADSDDESVAGEGSRPGRSGGRFFQ